MVVNRGISSAGHRDRRDRLDDLLGALDLADHRALVAFIAFGGLARGKW
jgi:hypothetical protein